MTAPPEPCPTVVFAGPTVTADEVRSHLPDAMVLPPAGCGDVLRACRLSPRRILMIDGFFQFRPAPWHKEILAAIEWGVEVWGSSSMGALRAAELWPFGMEGHGRIFEQYRDGVIEGDDEVTIRHGGPEVQFQQESDALCDVRCTLERAVEAQLVDPHHAGTIVEAVRDDFYPTRSLSRTLGTLDGIPPEVRTRLKTWLPDGFVRQKQLDAIAMLEEAALRPWSKPRIKEPTRPTIFLMQLLVSTRTNPLPESFRVPLPPVEEQVRSMARNAPATFSMLSRYARDLENCYVFAVSVAGSHPDPDQVEPFLQGFQQVALQMADTDPRLLSLVTRLVGPDPGVEPGVDDPPPDDPAWNRIAECRAATVLSLAAAAVTKGLQVYASDVADLLREVDERFGAAGSPARTNLLAELDVGEEMIAQACMLIELANAVIPRRACDLVLPPMEPGMLEIALSTTGLRDTPPITQGE